MKFLKIFKYLSPITFFAAAYISFISNNWLCWLPIIYGFVLIPFAELLIKPKLSNLNAAEEEMAKVNKWYDYALYSCIILMFPSIAFFLYNIKIDLNAININWFAILGKVFSMGFLCGTIGINVAHELGHRVNPFEQNLAKAGLLTSLYMHFFTEHNKGHHKNVATPNDPASSRFNESLYFFWPRTIIGSYISAWHIANEECHKKNISVFSLKNEMVLFSTIQIFFLTVIFIYAGVFAGSLYLIAAIVGILLLETVNYIEHYGLTRIEKEAGKFERTMPIHSWNSSHYLGRVMLFELSRHSDHHYLASRKYQILRHHENAPQLPTGYPGMMLLSTIPPLWFKIMNPKVKAIMENK